MHVFSYFLETCTIKPVCLNSHCIASFIQCAVLTQFLTLSCYFAWVRLWGDTVKKQQLNSINNSNGTMLQKLLTVIDDAMLFIFMLFYSKYVLCFLFVNLCF